MLLLAMHPVHQEKLYKELKRVMPNRDTYLTAEHFQQLDFTTRCIQEALRLFPTVPLIARCPIEPIKLNGIEIPANVPIILGLRPIQTREMYWGKDAKEFNPDHYLRPECRPENQAPGAFLGFSNGPRNCIGMLFCPFYITYCIMYIHILEESMSNLC